MWSRRSVWRFEISCSQLDFHCFGDGSACSIELRRWGGLCVRGDGEMKLNLHILADELRDCVPRILCDPSTDLVFSRYDIYRGQKDPSNDCLYLICANQLTPELAFTRGVNLLCFGDVDDAMSPFRKANILVLPDSVISPQFSARIGKIFAKYNDWSERLLTLCLLDDGIRKVFTTGLLEECFGNPILMQNGMGLYAISCGELPDDFDSDRWRRIVGFQECENDSLSGREEHLSGLIREPFISETTDRYSFLSTNAIVDGKFAGRLTHCNAYREFTAGYASLAGYLNSVLEMIAKRNMDDGLVGQDNSNVFLELLGSWHTSPEWVEGHLRKIGWRRDEAVYLVVCASRNREAVRDIKDVKFISARLSKVFPKEYVFEYKGDVIVVVRCQSVPRDEDDLQKRLRGVLSADEAVCAVSLVFFDVCKIKDFYDQCLYIVENGQRLSDRLVLFYEAFFLDHLLDRCGIGGNYSWIIDPRVALLRSYDKKCGTDLVKCLKVYIECCFSRKVAAQRLSVHYNTLKYKLEKVKEISQIDTACMMRVPGNELLHVLLSVSLLEHSEN